MQTERECYQSFHLTLCKKQISTLPKCPTFPSSVVTALFDLLRITVMLTQCSFILSSQDNFLRGDGNRRVQHQQQRKPRKKTKPPALTKKHKKKRRRGPRRPQKPIPPALPQGNLGMPSTSLAIPSQASIRSAPPVSLHC